MLPNSVEKIIIAAQACFYQHGYSAANVSLIGRYANISRATIYKNFSSKEAIFRAVVEEHITQSNIALIDYSQSKGDFWFDTEQLIYGRCQGIFDEVASSLIRSELIHAGQLYCHDLLLANKQLVQQAIIKRLEQEVTQTKLNVEQVGLSIEDFAKVIESAPIGIAFSAIEDNSKAMIKNIFQIFKMSVSRSR